MLLCSLLLITHSLTTLAQTDSWLQKANLGNDTTINGIEPPSRSGAVGFGIGSKGYIGTGGSYAKDFWEYDPAANTWTQKADFGGIARQGAVGFSIGNKGYIGTGGEFDKYRDFWEYDPNTNTWTRKADFPGLGRTSAVGFSINGKGFIGTGVSGKYQLTYYKDFWEYDPAANTWTQKADFGGTARVSAVGFSIGVKGYIGTGYSINGNEKDFWEYNPSSNTWTQKADFGGTERNSAVGFSIGSKGYIGTGYPISTPRAKDFWEYDPAANTWTQKADFGGTERGGGVGFSIGSKGYIGTGSATDGIKNDFREYDPAANTWTQKTGFIGNLRAGAVGFSIGSKGYLGTGQSLNEGASRYYKDFWEYDPATNAWTQKADFGGTARVSAVGFSIGVKGYIGTGYSINGNEKDFWEYNPSSNTWTQKADFGGAERSGAVGFSIGSKGYLGTGHDNTYEPFYKYKDFWEYDPATNTWTQKADFGGTERSGAVGFSIGSKGYLGTGYDTEIYYYKDFWEYNPAINKWTQKADFIGDFRRGAVGFSIGSKGYFGTGYSNAKGFVKDFWQYDPAANTWTQKADFGGTVRSDAVGFSIGNKGYLGTGASNNYPYYYKDFWEYNPGGGCPNPSNLSVKKISDTCARLNWNMPDPSVQYIRVNYRPVGTAAWNAKRKKSVNNGIYITDLIPNTTYEWKMRNICADDTTEWITGPNFTTLASTTFSSIADAANSSKVEGDISIQIMPNPNKGSFTLQMHLPDKAASTTLTLYNNLGAKVWEQKAGMLGGSVRRSITLENKLSAGVYIMVVQQNEVRLVQKIFVVK